MFRKFMSLMRLCVAATALMFTVSTSVKAQAPSGDPIKVGFSMSLTGATAPNGRQLLVALEIWRDDVNAAGGLLGRPVELVYYDDQSNPANVPALYQKLSVGRQSRSAARTLFHQHGGAGDAGDHAGRQDHDHHAGDRGEPALQL